MVFDRGITNNTLLPFKLLEEFVDIASTASQDFLRTLKHLHLCLELLEGLLPLFMLSIFLLQVCRVLPEIITLEVFAALNLLVLFFTLTKSPLKGNLLGLEALDLLLLLLLLFLDTLSLCAVD